MSSLNLLEISSDVKSKCKGGRRVKQGWGGGRKRGLEKVNLAKESGHSATRRGGAKWRVGGLPEGQKLFWGEEGEATFVAKV